MKLQIALEYDLRSHLIDDFATLLPVEIRLVHGTLGYDGGEPLVIKIVLAVPTLEYGIGKRPDLVACRPIASIHVSGKPENEPARRVFACIVAYVFGVARSVPGAVIRFKSLRGDAERIAYGKPYSLIAHVDGKITECVKHQLSSFFL